MDNKEERALYDWIVNANIEEIIIEIFEKRFCYKPIEDFDYRDFNILFKIKELQNIEKIAFELEQIKDILSKKFDVIP
jgi:hypothetical protein